MEFDRLRYIAAIARTGTMRGAAAALDVTPGAVSKAIARLEAETGTALVLPDGRGVRLTDEGAWLARRADHLVGELASLTSDLAARRDRDAELCIASYDAFAAWFPGRLAGRWLPGVPLSLRERWPGEVEDAVANGVSDCGITWVPVPTDGVEHEAVARVPLVVAVRRGAFSGVPFDELPFAVPSHAMSGAITSYGPLDGWPPDVARDVRFRASALEARLELARQGVAAVLVPAFVLALHADRAKAAVQLEPVAAPRSIGRLSRTVHLVRRRTMGPALAARVTVVRHALEAFCEGPA